MKLRFNLLTEVEPIFMHIKKSHTSRSKRDFWFICENEMGSVMYFGCKCVKKACLSV